MFEYRCRNASLASLDPPPLGESATRPHTLPRPASPSQKKKDRATHPRSARAGRRPAKRRHSFSAQLDAESRARYPPNPHAAQLNQHSACREESRGICTDRSPVVNEPRHLEAQPRPWPPQCPGARMLVRASPTPGASAHERRHRRAPFRAHRTPRARRGSS